MESYFDNRHTDGVGMDTSASNMSFGEKRKHDDDVEENPMDNLAEYCRQVRCK